MRWSAAMIVVTLAAGQGIASSGPVPCAETPFISDAPLSTDAARIVVVDAAGQVTIPGLCGPILARWRSRPGKRGVVRATWPSCGTATRVRLRMRYAPDCTSADGFFKSRSAPRIIFAAAPSRCGDDYLGAGEACELSTPCATPGDTCTDCQCLPPGSSTTTTTTPGGTTSTTLAGLFEAPNPWNQDISALPVAPESSTIIGALAAAGGWGTGSTAFQIDFSIHLLHASPTTMRLTFAPNGGYYLPDCDDPFPFPLPAGGAVEGESGYDCTSGGDCHLLVVDAAAKRLYEMYQGSLENGTLSSTCALSWDLTRSYPPNLRGEQCTSTDAAGFPVGALLFTADEVAAGDIPHAIRFTLPNDRMRAGVYVHPASHAGAPSGGTHLPPYGVRFRLRADFPLTGYPTNAQVILHAMQKYGLLLADGGNVPLTAASDSYTTHTWAELGIDSHSLFGVAVTDMEVVGLGTPVTLTYDCVRNP